LPSALGLTEGDADHVSETLLKVLRGARPADAVRAASA
jgi:hypothetical protein